MPFRRWFLPLMVTGALSALMIATCGAMTKPIPAPVPLVHPALGSVQAIENIATGENCGLGQTGPGGSLLNFIFADDDYFTAIRVVDCPGCNAATAVSFDTVRVMLYFPTMCSVPVQVSVVGATGTFNCPFPDPTTVRCPPQSFLLTPTDSLVVTEFELPIARCLLENRGFLRIKFVSLPSQCDTTNTKPRLVLAFQNPCVSCRSYNDYAGIDGVPEDLCSPADPIGNPVMFVDVDSCFVFTDTDPPARITDLQSASTTSDEVRLQWTAPGDDGMTGRATSYDIRRATFPLDSLNFTSGDSLTGTVAPLAPGSTEFYLAGGLTTSITYYFGIRTRDDAGNVSPISNILVATPGTGAPGKVLDLRTKNPRENRITLEWTATGDDDAPVGRPTSYLIAVSTQPIDDTNFASVRSDTLLASSPVGEPEVVDINELEAGTRYYFAVKARDDDANFSPISNVVNAQTLVAVLAGHDGAAVASRTQPSHLPVDLYWQAGVPNPTGAQSIRIFDSFGRLVRSMALGAEANGVVQWDGRDDHGRLVPAGIYVVRFTSGSSRAHGRVVLLR